MRNKNDAMENFQNAINVVLKKDEEKRKAEEMKRKKQEQQEEFERRKKENAPTNNSEETEEIKPQTEEEQEAEKIEDSKNYNIYDDDDYDDEDEDNNNPHNQRNRKKSKDKNSDDKDKVDTDSTDKDSKIDDSEKSSRSSSKSSNTQNDSTGTSGRGNTSASTDTVANTTGNTGASTASGAEATGTAAEAGAGAGATAGTAAGAGAGTGAGATAGATAGTAVAAGGPTLWIAILIIALVIIGLIILIGYIGFFINGVGLIREKLGKFADGIWTGVKGFFIGADYAQVKDEQICDIATYLENMGYDLVNYGFLDTDGKAVTKEENEDGTITIKSGDKVIYEKSKDDETNQIEVSKIKSKYIKAYLAAENNTYMIANKNWTFKNIFFEPLTDMDKWGTGMIHLENASSKVTIDRENKKMQIKYKGYVYQYDLDGWTGRYGKSLEFLLTLHLATQAPDFVYDIVTEEEFDTKVNIALRETTANIKLKVPDPNNEEELVEITESNYSSLGLSAEQWSAVYDYTKEPIRTFTPFITSVENHWYKDLDFTKCYVVAENNPDSTEDDEAFTSTYQYVGLEEDLKNDVLSQIENLYVEEVRTEDIFQVKEPMVKKNELIKEMLLGGKVGAENTEEKYKYYIYNGSDIPEEGLNKQYIINKVVLENSEEKLNTRGFTYAFAILESVHTEDAEYILRDLKELSKEVGIDLDEDGDKGGEEVEPLVWPVEGYKPVVWDPIYDAQNPRVIIKHKSEGTLGFDKDMNVLMPADGQIIQIIKEEERYDENNKEEDEQKSTRETSVGDAVKIKFTGTDRNDLKDMYIYISGLKLDDSVSVGSIYSAETPIGKTIESDIAIIMTDNRREVVYNVDDYIIPEDWDVLTDDKYLTDEIKDSQFKGDILGEGENGSGNAYEYMETQGDNIVNVSAGGNVVTDKSKIIAGLAWYREINPQGYNNIVNNIDYFIQIQNQYGVNAIFGIAVAITESGAGTSWNYIASYTHNWMSLAGAYKGKSYYSNRAWRTYNSFGEATLDFGNWISKGPYYFKNGKNTVSQIAPTYCNANWGNTVNGYMNRIISNMNNE